MSDGAASQEDRLLNSGVGGSDCDSASEDGGGVDSNIDEGGTMSDGAASQEDRFLNSGVAGSDCVSASEGGGGVDSDIDDGGTEQAAYCQTTGFRIKARRSPPRSMFMSSTTGLAPESAATQNRVIADIRRQTHTHIECQLAENRAFTYFTIRGATVHECQSAARLLAQHFDIIDGQSSIADSHSDADDEGDPNASSDGGESGDDGRGGDSADGVRDAGGDQPAPDGPDEGDHGDAGGANTFDRGE